MILKINNYLKRSTDSSKLAVFRICFGLMMLFSMVRFWSKDWIHTVYVLPKFHFKYYGFDWVQSLGLYTYVLFVICILCSILITIGMWYRLSIILFFLTFSYIELIEKTTYLNHYYLKDHVFHQLLTLFQYCSLTHVYCQANHNVDIYL